MPSVEQVSTHTPVYMFPDFEQIAADTSPQVMYSEILRSFHTAFAASYISIQIFSIGNPLRHIQVYRLARLYHKNGKK